MPDMPVILLDGTSVAGVNPLVVLGPNGVGKTRFGVALTRKNSAQRISALRAISFAAPPMKPLENAKNLVEKAINNNLGQWWVESGEIIDLMGSLIEGDKQAAIEYRTIRETNSVNPIPVNLIETDLIRVKKTWEELFPGRQIDISYIPTVSNANRGATMSLANLRTACGKRPQKQRSPNLC